MEYLLTARERNNAKRCRSLSSVLNLCVSCVIASLTLQLNHVCEALSDVQRDWSRRRLVLWFLNNDGEVEQNNPSIFIHIFLESRVINQKSILAKQLNCCSYCPEGEKERRS